MRTLALPAAAILLLVSVVSAQAPATGAAQTPAQPRLDVYGYVMTDFIFDFNQVAPDWFDVLRPTKLPAFRNEFGRDGRTHAGVRQTRFGVKGFQPTGLGELRTTFEWELFGVGVDAGQTTFRLRHAYGELGQCGAGQYWSPFMDIDVFPNTVEYWGPPGMVFFRNVQVRWMPIQGDTRLTIALERPGSTQDPGRLEQRIEIQNIRARFPYPDLSGEFRFGGSRGYIEAAGIVRKIVLDDLLVDDAFNLDDSIIGWGVNISSNIKTTGKNVFRLQYVYGEGIENYMNDAPADVAGVPNFGDPIRPVRGEALPVRGIVAFYDHYWTDRWSTSVGYSQNRITTTVLQSADTFRKGDYAIVNLLHYPTENVMYGGEFQWGRRTNHASTTGFEATDRRLQFSFRYNFSATIGGVK
jgi:hypothetical protein